MDNLHRVRQARYKYFVRVVQQTIYSIHRVRQARFKFFVRAVQWIMYNLHRVRLYLEIGF